ncbi:MAG: hypothetical protein RL518_1095 [Pseudomonadota bacterium]|jgi:hypothetical protein
MRRLFKRFAIALGIIGFITLVWANRTGRLAISRFDHGGVLTPVSESTPWKEGSTAIRIGIFAENIYDFNMATQSFASEGLVWVHWGPSFQKVLDSEGVTIEQVLQPVNRVNSWDWMIKPFYPKPLATATGDHYQLIRFAGRFYVDQLDLHRYPFEKLTVPVIWGLNVMSDVFNADQVRITADHAQSGVGSFIEMIGFATDKYEINEYVQTYPTSFGYKDAENKSHTAFSQVRLEVMYRKAPLASIQQYILPLLVVMFITLIAPSLAASLWDVRIAIPSTALLTLVFLQQGYRQNLPQLPYATYLDQIYVTCYMVTFALFCLFVWASNKLDTCSEEDKPEVIAQLNRVDSWFQLICVLFLATATTLNWFFPLRF